MRRTLFLIASLVLVITGWMGCITAGTLGSLAGYSFPLPKDSLQQIVNSVIDRVPHIFRDTVPRYMLDVTDGKSDTLWDTHYRDGLRYETIFIETSDDRYQFIFQYTGSQEEWRTSKESWISVAYANDSKGHGGSDGRGNVTSKVHKRLIGIFERELVDRVHAEIGSEGRGL